MAKEKRRHRRMYWPREPRELACMFTVFMRNVGSKNKPFPLEFVEETYNPEQWAMEHLAYYNRMRLAGEPEREIVYVVRRGRCAPQKHKWSHTLLPPVRVNGILLDSFQCTRCGVTGKRAGWLHMLEPRRDKKFEDPQFARCDFAAKIMEERRRGHGPVAKSTSARSQVQKTSSVPTAKAKR